MLNNFSVVYWLVANGYYGHINLPKLKKHTDFNRRPELLVQIFSVSSSDLFILWNVMRYHRFVFLNRV